MADSNYISRDWVSISATTNRQEMGNTFTNMLYSVSNMIAKEPVYTTWIIFQIGNKKPLIFNTATTNPKQNLIASLNFKKKGSGTANNFEITIQYFISFFKKIGLTGKTKKIGTIINLLCLSLIILVNHIIII